MRHGPLTTNEAIEILIQDDVIYWTEEEYMDNKSTVDWLMVAIFFNTNEIHSFGQGMKTVIYRR
jgi:hypothetical protein